VPLDWQKLQSPMADNSADAALPGGLICLN
jgi:hypothetical protein